MLSTWLSRLRAHLPSQRLRRRKEELRAVLAQKRRILTPEQTALCSQEVVMQLLRCPEFLEARHVLLYYPVHNEIDVRALLAAAPDKHFYLPVTHRSSLEMRCYDEQSPLKRGRFGIPEPQTTSFRGRPDLIVVPGVAFDKHMQRMGRGGGYYDRFLRKYKHTAKIGVGYAFQMVDSLPAGRHDVRLDQILTARSK